MKTLTSIIFFLFSFNLLSNSNPEITPTTRVYQSIEFIDDLSFDHLDLAIERQIKSYEQFKLTGNIRFGSEVYPKTELRESLLLLKKLVDETRACFKIQASDSCMSLFNAEVNAKFAIYRPVTKGDAQAGTHFTSYYSPDLHGARTPTERFKRAIYTKPDAPHDNYTRVEIDYQGALAGKGYEIFWVEESFFDLYLLHVQGGGRITILNPDGTTEVKYLSYNGKNNRSFRMIYHYMLERGYLETGKTGIPSQRRFLEENPEKEEEIFSSSPSYVYFKESSEEPVGLNNIPLTEGRSLAIDSRIYKTIGLINFIKTVRATHLDENGRVVKAAFSRFFIAQDTGGAIRGNARCDLYFGYGPLAELTAYNMNDYGEQYILIKK